MRRHHHYQTMSIDLLNNVTVTHVGGKLISTVFPGGKTKVFSVGSKEAASLAPASTFARVGTLGGK